MRWAGHATHVEEIRNPIYILVETPPEGKNYFLIVEVDGG
jgi:hypothetical protein